MTRKSRSIYLLLADKYPTVRFIRQPTFAGANSFRKYYARNGNDDTAETNALFTPRGFGDTFSTSPVFEDAIYITRRPFTAPFTYRPELFVSESVSSSIRQ